MPRMLRFLSARQFYLLYCHHHNNMSIRQHYSYPSNWSLSWSIGEDGTNQLHRHHPSAQRPSSSVLRRDIRSNCHHHIIIWSVFKISMLCYSCSTIYSCHDMNTALSCKGGCDKGKRCWDKHSAIRWANGLDEGSCRHLCQSCPSWLSLKYTFTMKLVR